MSNNMPPPINGAEKHGSDHNTENSQFRDDNQLDNASQFPCKDCGANLQFAPGQESLSCPYCGAHNEIKIKKEKVQENDFYKTLEMLDNTAETEEKPFVKCNVCSAQIEQVANIVSSDCPYCGSALVTTTQSVKRIKPKSLLPFKITSNEAKRSFKEWIKGLWFAPNNLKKIHKLDNKLNGMYMPFWTYDSDTITHYTGARGTYYYVTKTRTVMRDGKSVTETYQERRTRWTNVSGTVYENFDDILILASHSLPRKYADELDPWDLQNLVPYQDQYLAGFKTESYQVDLKSGFKMAKNIMDDEIRQSIRYDIGGDEQRIYSVSSIYNDITYKHILLPVWVCAYRYKEKVYRFLVNARTGEVQGERPWSWIKITLAALAGTIVVGGIVYAIWGEEILRAIR